MRRNKTIPSHLSAVSTGDIARRKKKNLLHKLNNSSTALEDLWGNKWFCMGKETMNYWLHQCVLTHFWTLLLPRTAFLCQEPEVPCKTQNVLSLIMSFIQIASIPQEQIIHDWENAPKAYFPAAFKGGLGRREVWMEIILGEYYVVKRISLGQMCLNFYFQLTRKKRTSNLFQFQITNQIKPTKIWVNLKVEGLYLQCFCFASKPRKCLYVPCITWSILIYNLIERICLT